MPEGMREDIAACLKKNETLKTLKFVCTALRPFLNPHFYSTKDFALPEDASWFLSSIPPNLNRFDVIEDKYPYKVSFMTFLQIIILTRNCRHPLSHLKGLPSLWMTFVITCT